MATGLAYRRAGSRAMALLLATALLLVGTSAGGAARREAVGRLVSVVVQGLNPFAARQAVLDHQGRVTYDLPIVDGVLADVPASQLPSIRADARVRQVSRNEPVHMQGVTASHPASDVFNQVIGQDRLQSEGLDGSGVTVAVVDSGVADVPDLHGRLIGGIDLSGENNPLQDSFGHGTFVAGLIAGNGASSNGQYHGVAPAAKVVSVKVAGLNGASDIGHVLAGMQWLVSFKDLYGIRVANLSFGTDSAQHYYASLLDYAVERVWDSGITVVVSSSNLGTAPGTITKPADDPLVITVGAMDDRGTPGRGDDVMAGFSGVGPTAADGFVKPDLVASGRSVVSLDAPGSYVDQNFAQSRIGNGYFRGSGTSFSTAIVSGAVALLLEREPSLTPGQVKYRLTSTAAPGPDPNPNVAGHGSLDAYAAAHGGTYVDANQGVPRSVASGTLDADRGSFRVTMTVYLPNILGNLVATVLQLTGDLVPTNRNFDYSQYLSTSWTSANWATSQWAGVNFNGVSWDGSQWWGSQWWGSQWWGSQWWGSQWWGSQWWDAAWYAASWD